MLSVNNISEDFKFWIQYGHKHGYISIPFCWAHELIPMSEYEEEMEDTPCIMAVRMFPQ